MAIFISPSYTSDDFKELDFDDKVNIFADRVFGWIFNVCREMIELEISNRDIAILKIVFSSFEMLGKHIEGYKGLYGSKKHFLIGVHEIFNELPEAAAELLYKYMRNYLYHSGFLCSYVELVNDPDIDMGYDEESEQLIINVKNFVIDMNNGFVFYLRKLRDSKNELLRGNFEKRFDFDHRHLIRH